MFFPSQSGDDAVPFYRLRDSLLASLEGIRRPATLGVEGMIGGVAQLMESGAKQMKMFYRGEIWRVICLEPVARDQKVKMNSVEGMKRVVKGVPSHRVKERSQAMERVQGFPRKAGAKRSARVVHVSVSKRNAH